MLIKDRKCFSHACLVTRREGGKKRAEYTELFFFVWVANKREIKRKMFTFLENTNSCLLGND